MRGGLSLRAPYAVRGVYTTLMLSVDSPLVLASASPRRRELLSLLGVRFDLLPVDVLEVVERGEAPAETARRLALLKLRSAVRLLPEAVVLAADTVVDLDGEALGKPRDVEDAVRMLQALRGRAHLVHTGVSLGWCAREESVVATTEVVMRPYTDGEIERYVASGEPMDKAGAYAIQDAGFRPVRRIRGSYTNVVGLPLSATARLLQLTGIEVVYDESLEGPHLPL